MRPVRAAVHRTDNLEDCLIALGHDDIADLPVLHSRQEPVMIGIITRRAILEVYNREVLHQEDMGIKLVSGEGRLRDCVDLPEAYKVQVLIPPAAWHGRNLRELELRRRFNVSVLAMKRHLALGGTANEMPDPDRPLREGDRLIIVGHLDDLERLLRAEVTRPPAA